MQCRVLPVVLLLLALGCDRLGASASEPAPSSGGASPAAAAPTPAAPAAAAPTSAPAVAAPAVAAAPTPTAAVATDCAAFAKHVDAVLRATGSALERSTMSTVEKMRTDCEADRNDPSRMQCFMAASDSTGLAKCSRDAFTGEVDATPRRSFDALKDNASVSPPVLTQDGDYLAYDRRCGMLFKELAPAAAIYIVCDGKAQIGPLVTADEVDKVVKQLSAQEDQRHRTVMGLIAKLDSKPMGVPVQVYRDGVYQGIEYR